MTAAFYDFDSYQDSIEESLFSYLKYNLGMAASLTLEPGNFSTPGRASLFAALQELARQDAPFNKRTVQQHLARTGRQVEEDWPTLFDHVTGPQADVEKAISHHARLLQDHTVRRQYYEWFSRSADQPRNLSVSLDAILQDHATMLATVQEQLTEDIDPSAAGILQRAGIVNTNPYFPSGLTVVDRNVKGLRKGHLWVIAAPYKGRKTTTALNVVAHQLREGRSVMYIALEADDQEFFDKLTAIWGDIPYHEVEGGTGEAVSERVKRAREELATKKLRIYDARKGVHKWKTLPALVAGDRLRFGEIDVVVIDYVQAWSTNYDTLQEIVPMLLRVCTEQKVAMIAISQMSNTDIRDGSGGPTGVLRTKASGDFGAACHVGIEIRREEECDNELGLVVKVARNGRPGTSFARLDPEVGRFQFQAASATQLKDMEDKAEVLNY